MLRMSALAFAGPAALGSAALTPSAAAAEWHAWGRRDAIEDRLERWDRREDRLQRPDRFEDRFEHRAECFGLRQVSTAWGWTWRRDWIC